MTEKNSLRQDIEALSAERDVLEKEVEALKAKRDEKCCLGFILCIGGSPQG